MENDTKKVVNITLKRNGMDIVMDIKTAPEIEQFFKNASLSSSEAYDDDSDRRAVNGITKTSRKWFGKDGEGLAYYAKSQTLSDKVGGYRIIDNFGNGLMEDGKINLAFLRCVGITEGVSIKTTDLLSLEEMKEFIQKLAKWTKAFYEKVLSNSEVVATVSVDLAKESEILAELQE